MNLNFPTAQEAKKLSDESVSTSVASELTRVKAFVDKAIKGGAFSCYCNFTLSSETVKFLIQKGYKVTDRSSQRDGVEFLIAWV